MADKRLMIDTSILIGYFRKTDKANSKLVSHFKRYNHLFISSITEFEIVNGATQEHIRFWDGMLLNFTILDFDSKAAREAAKIVAGLKKIAGPLISQIYLLQRQQLSINLLLTH